MPNKKTILCLDVGERRIGVAVADTSIKIAIPIGAVEVDGKEIENIKDIFDHQNAQVLVIGYPRNQSGEVTQQTKFVEDFATRLVSVTPEIVFQDESLTSVIAEQRLSSHNKPYSKSDIDAMAAAIILDDYIELNYA